MAYLGPSLRRRRRASRPWQRFVVALLLSLLANGLLLTQVRLGWKPGERPPVVRQVSLAPLSAAEWEANRATRGATPLVAPAPLPPEPPRAPPGQVVEVAPSKDTRPPENARFASDRDNRVEKETVSRHRRAGYERTLAKPSAKAPERKGAASPPAQAAAAPGKPGEPAPRPQAKAGEKLAMLDEGGDVRLHSPAQEQRAPAPAPGGERGQGGREALPRPFDPSRLQPSASFYERLSGGPAPDHVEDVDEGEGTFLNTREWKYAGYFNRMKQAVAASWDPHTPLAQRDPTGSRFAYKDRITVLQVTLDDQGGLAGLAVRRSSGVDFLDQAALDAFRKAQPFPNPPHGLAENGAIQFTFGFYLEVGSPAIRLFRGPATPH